MENFILCAVNIEVCTTFEIFSGRITFFPSNVKIDDLIPRSKVTQI